MSESQHGAAIARELQLSPGAVAAALRLLLAGNTVPFVARYRKEATGALDEVQLRQVQARHEVLEDLGKRRTAILASLEERSLLTGELRTQLEACSSRSELEDLYAPHRPQRRTRATKARERGLEPLALRILAQPQDGDPRREATAYVDPSKEVPDADAALAGARDVVAEVVANDPDRRRVTRAAFRAGSVTSKVKAKHRGKPHKFTAYESFAEPAAKIPAHRLLAVERGTQEGVLRSSLEIDAPPLLRRLADLVGLRRGSPWEGQLREAIDEAYKRLLAPSLEREVRAELKARADEEAIRVFAANLSDKLLSAPLGPKTVIGIDPGLRTGCKLSVVDAAGAHRQEGVLQLVRSESEKQRASEQLVELVKRHEAAAVAVGNGTGGREAEGFVRKTLKQAGLGEVPVVSVDESGASVYSASELAGRELPDLDLTIRGAVSIARRLQDPLAELVKVEPQALGIGQYQHDVDTALLTRALGEVVEDCVSSVGVDLNTASPALLAHVAGLGPAVAERIVAYRAEQGTYTSRRQLLKVPRLGPKAFEQIAGFLRVRDGKHPLDASAVHPERYALVERIAADLGVPLASLVGDAGLVGRIELSRYVDDEVGEPTLRDVLAELEKPGRDPRAAFEPPRFRDDVHELTDLTQGMQLEGVVTNVVAFGAFVDVGVHQDGLIHISQLADHYVSDPHQVVRVGDRLQVRVLEVDLDRRRISLSARSSDSPDRAR